MSLRTLVGVIMVAFLFSGNAIAALTFTGTPTNSWAYFIKPEPSVGENDQYFVTSQSAYAGATFQGYVSDAPWGLGQPRAADLIFSTFVTSATTQQIPLILDGDDGHSLFVNNAFVGGGPFGADVLHTLNLTAGVPVRLDMAGFNGPGGWVFVLQTVAGVKGVVAGLAVQQIASAAAVDRVVAATAEEPVVPAAAVEVVADQNEDGRPKRGRS